MSLNVARLCTFRIRPKTKTMARIRSRSRILPRTMTEAFRAAALLAPGRRPGRAEGLFKWLGSAADAGGAAGAAAAAGRVGGTAGAAQPAQGGRAEAGATGRGGGAAPGATREYHISQFSQNR